MATKKVVNDIEISETRFESEDKISFYRSDLAKLIAAADMLTTEVE